MHSARIEDWVLRALWVFTAFAIAGFGTFGLHPELLGRFPALASLYAPAFEFFAVGQVWIAFGALAILLFARAGVRWLPALVALYLLSLGSELAGTSFGVPFGDYRYTDLMEPKWLGLVPIVIPLSWFYMGLASFALASRLWPSPAARLVGGATLLAAWDLALDPAMSYATRYWAWEIPGAYYGMPLVNLVGWFATGLVLMSALTLLRTSRWVDDLPLRWVASFYMVNLVLPTGMNLAAGLWIAGVIGIGLTGVVYWLSRPGATVAPTLGRPRPTTAEVAR